MTDNVEVLIARLDGRIETLTQVVGTRLDRLDADTEQAALLAKQARHDLTDEAADIRKGLGELQEFRSRLLGMGAGIALASGALSGTLVAIIQAASNGG